MNDKQYETNPFRCYVAGGNNESGQENGGGAQINNLPELGLYRRHVHIRPDGRRGYRDGHVFDYTRDEQAERAVAAWEKVMRAITGNGLVKADPQELLAWAMTELGSDPRARAVFMAIADALRKEAGDAVQTT